MDLQTNRRMARWIMAAVNSLDESATTRRDDASLDRDGDGGGTVAHAELLEDVEEVSFDRRLAHEQLASDARVGQAARHALEHLHLPPGKIEIAVAHALHESRRYRRCEHGLARRRAANRIGKLIPRRVFE